MAARKLVVTKYNDYVLLFVLDADGKTVTVEACSPTKSSMLGNIYAGNVTDVIPSINGVFIEIEDGVKGFLHLDNKCQPIFLNTMRNPGNIRQGDIVLVQVVTDPIKSKDATLSAEISIPGRYGVLVSGEKGVKISSKIKKEADFKELKLQIDEKYAESEFGFILRTAACKADQEQILNELEGLSLKWQQLLKSGIGSKKCMLMEADSPIISKIKSGLGNEFDEIVSDDVDCYREITAYLEKELPNEVEAFKPYRDLKLPLRIIYSIEKRLDEALNRIVHLRSGGFLVIEPTEAMCVIDVNSGKSVSKRQAEREYLDINCEAAKEIARQIRLRNLSGIIIVDFINMKSKESNDTLIREMKGYLRDDPVKPTVVDMTGLGLMEITRKKVKRPLYETMKL